MLLRKEHSGCKRLLENMYWICQSSVTQNSVFNVQQVQFLFVDVFAFHRGEGRGKMPRKMKQGKQSESY